jgi:hypothetical protein
MQSKPVAINCLHWRCTDNLLLFEENLAPLMKEKTIFQVIMVFKNGFWRNFAGKKKGFLK